MAENDGGLAPPLVDNSPSLVSVVGEMYGDYAVAEPEDDAGAPPAEIPDPTPRSEGDDASAPAGDTPGEADGLPSLDTEQPDSPIDEDPFEGSRAFDYTVEGQSRAFEGITVLKNGGGIIDPEAMQKVMQRFSERDHLFEKSQAEYQKRDSLERMTTWPVQRQDGFHPNGQPRYVTTELKGRDALLEMRNQAATHAAMARTYVDAVLKPDQLVSLVDVVQAEDGKFYIVPKADAIEALKQRAENTQLKWTAAAQRNFQALETAPAPMAAQAIADPTSYAAGTIAQFEQDHAVQGLTPADRTFLAQEFRRYVNTDAKGAPVSVDARFLEVMKDRAQLRSDQKASVTSATTAAKTNTARLAAASLGRGSKQAPRIPPKVEPERSRDDDFQDAWDRHERAAAGALRSRVGGQL